jgi:ABC-2 type transport system ATP-binding protein
VDNTSGEITVPVGSDGTLVLTEAVRRLDEAKIPIADIALRRPSLDDVFLSLTGHLAEGDGEVPEEAAAGARKGRR